MISEMLTALIIVLMAILVIYPTSRVLWQSWQTWQRRPARQKQPVRRR